MNVGLNGALVHARRVAAGLTVLALADHGGVHADVIWAIEEGNDRQLDQLPVVTIVTLAQSLDLRPSELFADQDAVPTRPAPDDVAIEAALLQHGATVTCEQLALAFGWPLARLERALAALHQRPRPTGARLHPVGTTRYVIVPNRHALTAPQWIQLGHARSEQAPFTVDAATVLYHLISLHEGAPPRRVRRQSSAPNTWRTDAWDTADEGLRQLREQALLDGDDPRFSASRDVRYSLGLDD